MSLLIPKEFKWTFSFRHCHQIFNVLSHPLRATCTAYLILLDQYTCALLGLLEEDMRNNRLIRHVVKLC